jgi:hypothetical protein
MNVTGSQQQPKKSTNAGGRDALVLNPGVDMPIDIMAVVRWQTKERNWLNRVFRSGSKVALEAKAALYLMSIQVLPPYFVHQRDLAQLQQWISEGILMPQLT